jgi:hypothetical protein
LLIALGMCGLTIDQKNLGYADLRPAGLEYPNFSFIPVSANSANNAETFRM